MNQVRCPTCQAPMSFQARSEWPDFPFCSLKCRRVDLNRWFKESYRVGGDESPSEKDLPAEDDS
ncbi:MAG: DNA gyrase inhibitor YacG [Gemmataceae bacterium]|nr:DNA gyrase inhibitor YacG [Gemmataceae bacterium]